MSTCHEEASRLGVRSSSQDVNGTTSGTNEERSWDPLKRRLAPGSWASAIARSPLHQSNAAAEARPPNRMRLRRDTSTARGVIFRAQTCQIASGMMSRAVAKCTQSTVKGPMWVRHSDGVEDACGEQDHRQQSHKEGEGSLSVLAGYPPLSHPRLPGGKKHDRQANHAMHDRHPAPDQRGAQSLGS